MNKKLFIIILLIILILLLIQILSILQDKYNTKIIKDKFTDGKSMSPQEIIENDGKMTFNYINDPNYSNRIISQYYLDDDIRINGMKVNSHPYTVPIPNCATSVDLRPFIYSVTPSKHCRRNIGANDKSWWRKFDTEAQELYNIHGVYR